MAYVIGTAGHVDHGKSTLVHTLTGIDPDRLAEEKTREMTIDLGFAWLTLPNGESVGIIDVPGHRDFVENMLAGVGGIDLTLFVVAADEGVMPQTREHLAILDLLQIPRGIVALTKIDMIEDPDWLDLISLDLEEVFKDTILAGAPIAPVSARTGAGLERLVAELESALGHALPRPDRGQPRLPIDRAFTISGFGTVVTGTLHDGSFAVGDDVEIAPSGKRARIRGLQNHKHPVSRITPGNRVAVNLGGVNVEELQRGQVVTAPGLLRGTTLIDVSFRHLADAPRPLRHNAEVKFFSGAAEVVAHARLLGDRELAPGVEGWLQLRLSDPLALARGDRFILRYPSPGQTIGGGVVLDPHPAHRWRRFKPEVLTRLHTLAIGTPDGLLLQVLEGHLALTREQAQTAAGLASETELSETVAALAERGDVILLPGGGLMAVASWRRLADRLERELRAYHANHPLRAGMPREALRSRLEVDAKWFGGVMMLAVERGALVDEGATVRLTDHQIRFSPMQQAAVDRLWQVIRENPAALPSVKEVIALVGEDVFQVLLDRGDLMQVSADVVLDRDTYQRWTTQVRDWIEREGSITVAQARDLFSTSRKYVLALLEYMDSLGITRRVGDERTLKT